MPSITPLFTNFIGGTRAVSLLAIRLAAGTAFMFHGWNKIHNPLNWMGADNHIPSALQALAAISEFFGGLAWILGLLTPLASFGILCTMGVATWFHFSKGDPFVGKNSSYELALIYFTIALVLLLCGPGVISLDRLIFARKPVKGKIKR